MHLAGKRIGSFKGGELLCVNSSINKQTKHSIVVCVFIFLDPIIFPAKISEISQWILFFILLNGIHCGIFGKSNVNKYEKFVRGSVDSWAVWVADWVGLFWSGTKNGMNLLIEASIDSNYWYNGRKRWSDTLRESQSDVGIVWGEQHLYFLLISAVTQKST